MSKVTLKVENEEEALLKLIDAIHNATTLTESDNAISRQTVHDWISENEFGDWMELSGSIVLIAVQK